MSDDLIPTITRAGLAALRNAQGTGLLATIDRIVIGTGVSNHGYTPTGGERSLKTEIARVPILQGVRLGDPTSSDPIGFRVLAVVPPLADGLAPAPITEVGFILTDGTLLGVWSDPDEVLAYTTASASLELALDLFLQQVPAGLLAITVQRPDLPDMTGVLAKLVATNADLLIGQLTDEWRFPLTPRAGTAA